LTRALRRTTISTSRHTPAALAAALQARWQNPSAEQKQALGALWWQALLDSTVAEAIPRSSFDEAFTAVMTGEATHRLWQSLPREVILSDLHRLRSSGLTLGEIVGPEGARLLRDAAGGPWKPNRELTERLLDQPVLRQALRSMVQKTFQQFLSQINPLGGPSSAPGRGSVLGAIGRGIASRAEKAAQIGKTFMEGVGGGLYKQLEDQLQPFLAGFMSRSVGLLTEGIFEGEQAKLASEARVHGLEILLGTPLDVLLPPPEKDGLERNLCINEAIAAHVMSLPGYRDSFKRLADTLYDKAAARTVREVLAKFEIPAEAQPAFLEALGQIGYHYLSRPAMKDFLKAELEAIW
jgi:hypothetical protein